MLSNPVARERIFSGRVTHLATFMSVNDLGLFNSRRKRDQSRVVAAFANDLNGE